ncbi:MAG: hypothetical protein K1X94_18720 [Sandaracinaceae bacterium]|nr:hypothetical protein [Sandaracinaceae bacterium]
MRSVAALLVVLALVPLAAAPARADDPICEELPDAEVEARLREVRGYVTQHEPDTRHWATAFLSLHLTMVGVQLSLAISADNEGAIVDGWVGTLSSTLGIATLLISWPSLIGAGDAIDELPTGTPEERRYALARAEQRMRRASDQVAYVRSPFTTILNALYVGAAGSFTLIGWGRVTGGYLLAAGGSVLSQTRVLLFPTGIREAWLRYHRAHPDAGCEPEALPAEASAPSVTVMPNGLGASLLVAF